MFIFCFLCLTCALRMSPEPHHPSRVACPGNNRNSRYTRGKFAPCSSVVRGVRACINTRKARRSVAVARSVDECYAREVDFRVFDGIRDLLKNGNNE